MAGQETTLSVSPTAEATSHPEAVAALGEEEESEEELETGEAAQGEGEGGSRDPWRNYLV